MRLSDVESLVSGDDRNKHICVCGRLDKLNMLGIRYIIRKAIEMVKPDPLETRFRDFVEAAAGSAEDLEFMADNLGEELTADYSVQSLENAEKLFWRCVAEGMPEGLGELGDFAHLLARYCGECAIRSTQARWAIAPRSHPLHPQPIIEDFGKEEWDQVFPIDLANQHPVTS